MVVRVAIAGGGTGGHVFPAIAIADEIKRREPETEILFVGTKRGVEMGTVPLAGYRIVTISAMGFRRQASLDTIKFPFVVFTGLLEAIAILRRFRPSLAVGTGGYVSGPVILAAYLLRLPCVIHEQNIYPGLTTRLLSRIARQVHLSYLKSAEYFKRTDNLILSGNPTRQELNSIDKKEARRILGLDEEKRTVIVFGGSQGAHSINMALIEALDGLSEVEDLQIIWQTGKKDYSHVKKEVTSRKVPVVVRYFIHNMVEALGAADLAVTRAGGMTIADLNRCGLPAILIPLPSAAANHQQKNAESMVRFGAASLILDEDLSGERLEKEILYLLSDRSSLEGMEKKSKMLAEPEAARKIVDSIYEAGLIKQHDHIQTQD